MPEGDLKQFDKIYIYGARDPIHYSGSPYYFMQSLREVLHDKEGSLVCPISLKRVREIPLSYIWWALKNRTFEDSAFFFSEDYHQAGVNQTPILSGRTAVISFTGLVAPRILEQIHSAENQHLYLYRDATYIQLLDQFKYARTIVGQKRADLIARETEMYHLARRLFVFDNVMKDILMNQYKIEEKKIVITGRGLNMSRAEFDFAGSFRNAYLSSPQETIAFTIVGREARRKGVFEVIEAIDALSVDEKKRIRLRIIGPDRGSIPQRNYLERFGFVTDKNKLLEILANTDVGVLMSSAEGGVPGSLREFTCLGIPCWVAWLPQYEGGLDERLIFKERFPLVTSNMTQTLREIISHSTESLSNKGVSGFGGYVGWVDQAQTVYKHMKLD